MNGSRNAFMSRRKWFALQSVLWAVLSALLSTAAAEAQINITEAQIGCLDLHENRGNLSAVVSSSCDGKFQCTYKAPNPDAYNRMRIKVHGRTFCAQAMEIKYRCVGGAAKSAFVRGDAWNHPPAELDCGAKPLPPQRGAALRGFVDLHTRARSASRGRSKRSSR